MIRTQIYLTEQEQTALRGLSSKTGKTQSQLIREAIDRLITQAEQRPLGLLEGAATVSFADDFAIDDESLLSA